MTATHEPLAIPTRSTSLSEIVARFDLRLEMAEVDDYMESLVTSPVLTLAEPARHVIAAGGKRLRALLVLLTTRLNHHDRTKAVAVASAV